MSGRGRGKKNLLVATPSCQPLPKTRLKNQVERNLEREDMLDRKIRRRKRKADQARAEGCEWEEKG
jgi:hypothetical protein